MKRVAAFSACIVMVLVIGVALASMLSGKSGVYGLSRVSAMAPASAAPGSADSLYALEVATLTRKGISPARAGHAIAVQSKVAQTHLVSKIEAAMGERFAGVWFEPAAAKLHVGVTSSASRRTVQRVAARAGLAAHVTETPVRSTWAQLVAAERQLSRRHSRLFADGVLQAGIAPQGNIVSIALSSSVPSPERAALRHAAADANVNVNVNVVPNSELVATRHFMSAKCNAFTTKGAACDPPLTAGVRIEDEPKFVCTAGPLAISKTTKSETYMLTAGHCLTNPGGIGSKWFALNRSGKSKEIGAVAAFFDETKGDVGAVHITKAGYWLTTKGAVTGAYAETAEWSVKNPEASYTVEGEQQSTAGEVICHEGTITGQVCGIFSKINTLTQFGEPPGSEGSVEGLAEVINAPTKSGDSGGPWLFVLTSKTNKPVLMAGTEVGGTTTKAYFEPLSKAYKVLSSLNLELLTKGNE